MLADFDETRVKKKYKIDNKILVISNNHFLDIEAYIQMNIKEKRVKNMSIIDFKKVVIISNSDKI